MKYILQEKIGEGAFGNVFKIKDENEEIFAAKFFSEFEENVIDYFTDNKKDDEIFKNNSELFILSKLNHPNIIKYINYTHTNNYIVLITEHWGESIVNLTFTPSMLKLMMKQLLLALQYLHEDYIHSDLKPLNIVMKDEIFKIIDFGSVISVINDESDIGTTRYYCAPEVLSGEKCHTTSIDIWSLGCIFYQKYSHQLYKEEKLLFEGNCNLDQLYKIFCILGTPSKNHHPELLKLPIYQKYLPIWPDSSNRLKMKNSVDKDFLFKLINLTPSNRLTAYQALQHEYFK